MREQRRATGIATMLGSAGPVDVSAACAAIEGWDRRNNLESRGGLL